MVLGVASRAERCAARALEAERGGVHEHHGEVGEEVAPAGEQRLLEAVLHAARREGGGVGLLGLGQFLAEPGHGPVEMVQRQLTHPRNGVILHPVGAGAVRTRGHQPVQHGDEHGALDVEFEAAPGQVVLHHRGAAGLLPEPPEQERRADAVDRKRRVAALDRLQDDGALGEAADGGGEAIQGAGGEDRLLAAEIADDALLRAAVLADGLHEVEVGVALDALLADEHEVSIGAPSQSASKISRSDP